MRKLFKFSLHKGKHNEELYEIFKLLWIQKRLPQNCLKIAQQLPKGYPNDAKWLSKGKKFEFGSWVILIKLYSMKPWRMGVSISINVMFLLFLHIKSFGFDDANTPPYYATPCALHDCPDNTDLLIRVPPIDWNTLWF